MFRIIKNLHMILQDFWDPTENPIRSYRILPRILPGSYKFLQDPVGSSVGSFRIPPRNMPGSCDRILQESLQDPVRIDPDKIFYKGYHSPTNLPNPRVIGVLGFNYGNSPINNIQTTFFTRYNVVLI